MPETHFFVKAADGLPAENISTKDRNSIQRKLLKKSRIKLDKKIPENLTALKEIFEYVIDQFNPEGTRTFLEKTPRHVFFYSKILEFYPDAKFICMIREPKNVISSQLINSSQSNKSIIRLALLFNKITTAITRIRHHSNTFLVKYEDLTTDTDLVLRQVCEFLNIAFKSKFIENVAAPPEIVSEHEFWKNRNLEYKTIHKSNPDKWREALDGEQENLVNFITGSHAAEFGYNLEYMGKGLIKGFYRDMRNLLSLREFKKLFSNVHG